MKNPIQAKLGCFINQLLSLAVMLRSCCSASQPLAEKQRDPEALRAAPEDCNPGSDK